MSTDSPFAITGIPMRKDANWFKHHAPGSGKEIPYVQNIPARCEITDWFNKVKESPIDSELKKQWTLFILGLERFMKMEISDPLSYFRIAGIHGFPLQPWDSAPDPVKGGQKPGDNPDDGYCHHNTAAFPTWHRPYLMLFEQCVWLNMNHLLDGIPLPGSPNRSDQFRGLTKDEKDKWKAAADNWRLPYWDWARRQENSATGSTGYAYPASCTVSEVDIWLPGQQTRRYPNPLERFECPERDVLTGKPKKFGEIKDVRFRIQDDHRPVEQDPEGEVFPWSQCSATSRYGILREKKDEDPYTGLDGGNAKQREEASKRGNRAIANATNHFYYLKRGKKDRQETDVRSLSLGDAIIRMLSDDYNGTWGEFASTKWYREEATDAVRGYMSLEYIHNNLHNLTGGSRLRPRPQEKPEDPLDDCYGLGHMCEVPVAAFDPIFWLFHGNIDRLCAIWQALYWEKWWDRPQLPEDGKKDYQRVEEKRPDGALEPFHRGIDNDGNVISWTSDACRDWTVGGYTYDDLIPPSECLERENGPLKEKEYQDWLKFSMMRRYYTVSKYAQELLESPNSEALFGKDVAKRRDTFQDYVLNIVYDRYALNGLSYSIRFYLSRHAPEDDCGTDNIAPDEQDYVGEVHSYSGLPPATENKSGCTNCGSQKASGTLSKAQISITAQLLLLASDKKEDCLSKVIRKHVKPFLQRNLSWKYTSCSGIEMSEDKFPKTEIVVCAGLSRSVRADTKGGSLSYLDAGSIGKKAFTTPLFGVDTDGQYEKLLDAGELRRAQQRAQRNGEASSIFEGYSSPKKTYEEDEW